LCSTKGAGFWDELLFFAFVIFAIKGFEASIAQRVVKELQKPPKPPKPKIPWRNGNVLPFIVLNGLLSEASTPSQFSDPKGKSRATSIPAGRWLLWP
jgi:hypothetical protein